MHGCSEVADVCVRPERWPARVTHMKASTEHGLYTLRWEADEALLQNTGSDATSGKGRRRTKRLPAQTDASDAAVRGGTGGRGERRGYRPVWDQNYDSCDEDQTRQVTMTFCLWSKEQQVQLDGDLRVRGVDRKGAVERGADFNEPEVQSSACERTGRVTGGGMGRGGLNVRCEAAVSSRPRLLVVRRRPRRYELEVVVAAVLPREKCRGKRVPGG
eukprot:1122136-Pleurochrysis_carterae.AAC.1